MAYVFPLDRVRNRSVSAGLDDFVLGAAHPDFRDIVAVLASGNSSTFTAVLPGHDQFEIGDYTLVDGVLQRTTIRVSTNANAKVAFSPGTKDIWMGVPSFILDKMVSAGRAQTFTDGEKDQALTNLGIANHRRFTSDSSGNVTANSFIGPLTGNSAGIHTGAVNAAGTTVTVGNGAAGGGFMNAGVSAATGAALTGNASNGSFTGDVAQLISASSSASGTLLRCLVGSNTRFALVQDGNAYADLTWNAGGADHGDYFEWKDGNPNGEDRVGRTVVIDGRKIRLSRAGDRAEDVIGAVSGNLSFAGNHPIAWSGKYARDAFNRYVLEPYRVRRVERLEVKITVAPAAPTLGSRLLNQALSAVGAELKPELVERREEIWHPEWLPEEQAPAAGEFERDGVTYRATNDVTDRTEGGQPLLRRKLNQAFDPAREYTFRKDRPEWAAVGLNGRIPIRRGELVHPSWRLMGEVAEGVDEYLVR